MSMRGVYVETLIKAPPDKVWERSQDPAEHQRWDARFTRIGQAATGGDFRYATRVLPGLTISGRGTAVGRRRADGAGTSALRFGSTHPLSLVRTGRGYWRYVPTPRGVRFLTGYDYTPGWGRAGHLADRMFRPVMGWATAWSFDRFRIWLETGRSPEQSRRQALAELAVRGAIVAAAVLVPPLSTTPAARRCRRRP
jgi:hypothetical protein